MVDIQSLLPAPIEIQVGDGKVLKVRALELAEMMQLFVTSQDQFLTLYAKLQQPGTTADKLAPLLIAAPEFVADVLAVAADAHGQQRHLRRLPGPVQLIALYEVWRASVPDPKKLQGLLSVVMAELRSSMPEGKPKPQTTLNENSEQASQPL